MGGIFPAGGKSHRRIVFDSVNLQSWRISSMPTAGNPRWVTAIDYFFHEIDIEIEIRWNMNWAFKESSRHGHCSKITPIAWPENYE